MIAVTMIAAAFLMCLLAGLVALLRAGIAREESDKSLRSEPATLAALLTRYVVGLYVRMPQSAPPAGHTADQTGTGQGQCPPAAGPGR